GASNAALMAEPLLKEISHEAPERGLEYECNDTVCMCMFMCVCVCVCVCVVVGVGVCVSVCVCVCEQQSYDILLLILLVLLLVQAVLTVSTVVHCASYKSCSHTRDLEWA